MVRRLSKILASNLNRITVNNVTSQNPFHIAVRNAWPKIVRLLLANPDIDVTIHIDGLSPAHYAKQQYENAQKIIKDLMKHPLRKGQIEVWQVFQDHARVATAVKALRTVQKDLKLTIPLDVWRLIMSYCGIRQTKLNERGK